MIGLALGVKAKTTRSFRTAPPEKRSSTFYDSSMEAAPGPGDSDGLGFGKNAEKAASMEGIIFLSPSLLRYPPLTYYILPGIPLPECPQPLPTYSPSRPPSLKSRNISSTT